MTTKRTGQQRGATLVEVLIAIALAGVLLPTFAQASLLAKTNRPSAEQRIQAASLLREATEAVRVVREGGWANVSTDGTYHPAIASNTWSLAGGSEVIGNFTRQIVINSIQRNISGTIVSSGGIVDPSTKQVIVTVSWTHPIVGSLISTTYLTRWQNNAAWTQKTQAAFAGGTLTNTVASASNTVQLLDTPATWQLPNSIGSFNITGNVSAVPYMFIGYATGMAIINVSNPASPSLAGTFVTSAAVNGVYVVGTTAYLATAIANAQLKIVNVATPATPTQIGTLQVGSGVAATNIYVNGTYAYLTKNAETGGNSEFNIIDVTTPSTPNLVGKFARQNANFLSTFVVGNFAYVATAQANNQFRIINVTSKTAPTSSSSVNLAVTANDIFIDGTTAYIGTANNGATGELRIYNVTIPTAPAALGNYEVSGNVTGVGMDTTNPNYVILATGVATKQAIIVNVSVPATPTLVNNVNYGKTINKVFVNGPYAYFGTTNTAQEAMILYTGFRPNGIFESSTFDAGANAGYNALGLTINTPVGSTLQFQVAANNTGLGWTYVGPDGTAGTFFTANGPISLSIASNRYFRYEATFTPTANGQQTPTISSVSTNYSL
jgi:hypothetical protein